MQQKQPESSSFSPIHLYKPSNPDLARDSGTISSQILNQQLEGRELDEQSPQSGQFIHQLLDPSYQIQLQQVELRVQQGLNKLEDKLMNSTPKSGQQSSQQIIKSEYQQQNAEQTPNDQMHINTYKQYSRQDIQGLPSDEQDQEQAKHINIYSQNSTKSNQMFPQKQANSIQQYYYNKTVNYQDSRNILLYANGMKKLKEKQDQRNQIIKERQEQELEKCTFSPKIIAEAASLKQYVPITLKTQEFQQKQQILIEQHKNNSILQEQSKCTFAPQLCQRSRLLAQGQEKSTVYDRNYKWLKEVNDKRTQYSIHRYQQLMSPAKKYANHSRVSSPKSVTAGHNMRASQSRIASPPKSSYFDFAKPSSPKQSWAVPNATKYVGYFHSPALEQMQNDQKSAHYKQVCHNLLQQSKNRAAKVNGDLKRELSKKELDTKVNEKLGSVLNQFDMKKKQVQIESLKTEISDTYNIFQNIKKSLEIKNQYERNLRPSSARNDSGRKIDFAPGMQPTAQSKELLEYYEKLSNKYQSQFSSQYKSQYENARQKSKPVSRNLNQDKSKKSFDASKPRSTQDWFKKFSHYQIDDQSQQVVLNENRANPLVDVQEMEQAVVNRLQAKRAEQQSLEMKNSMENIQNQQARLMEKAHQLNEKIKILNNY